MSQEITSWALARQNELGRKLRVLHVGNIGWNSYLNAKCLNEIGIENHVIIPDLFHWGTAPEWYEGATVKTNRSLLGNDFFPNLWGIGLPDQSRPDWVASGPLAMCQHYFRLLCDGDPAATLARDALEYERFKISVFERHGVQAVTWADQEFEDALIRLNVQQKARERFRQVRSFSALLKRAYNLFETLQTPQSVASLALPLPRAYVESFRPFCGDDFFDHWDKARGDGTLGALGYETVPLKNSTMPVRPEGIRADDWESICDALPGWNDLFDRYDHIILTSSEAMLGALTRRSYLAYEHGTIRREPFIDTPIGRMTRYGYQNARKVFVTNVDYVTAKPRLEFAPDQLRFIPHGFDERLLQDFQARHADLAPPKERVEFLWTARQDWLSRDARLAKQSDFVIKAAALVKKETKIPFKVFAVAWGTDLNASKALVTELGLDDVFEWIAPLDKGDLWRKYLSSHCVIDQFMISVVNGTTPEVMMLGRRVMSYDDGHCAVVAYGEAPPYLSAQSVEEIKARFLQVIHDPDDTGGVGLKSKEWMLKHHVRSVIAKILVEALSGAPNQLLGPTPQEVKRDANVQEALQQRRKRSVFLWRNMPFVAKMIEGPSKPDWMEPRVWIGHDAANQTIPPLAPAIMGAKRGLKKGYSIILIVDNFNSDEAKAISLGSLVAGESYQIYCDTETGLWLAVGPNGSLPQRDGRFALTASTNLGPPPGSNRIMIWGLELILTPDGAALMPDKRRLGEIKIADPAWL